MEEEEVSAEENPFSFVDDLLGLNLSELEIDDEKQDEEVLS